MLAFVREPAGSVIIHRGRAATRVVRDESRWHHEFPPRPARTRGFVFL